MHTRRTSAPESGEVVTIANGDWSGDVVILWGGWLRSGHGPHVPSDVIRAVARMIDAESSEGSADPRYAVDEIVSRIARIISGNDGDWCACGEAGCQSPHRRAELTAFISGLLASLVAENLKLRLDIEATQTRPLTVDLQRAQAEREALRDEVGSLRAALGAVREDRDDGLRARKHVQDERDYANSYSRQCEKVNAELRIEVETLKHDLAEQVKLRQEAQDQFVEEARRRKQGDDANPTIIQQRSLLNGQQQEILSLRGQCEALRDRIETSQPSHSRAVEQLAEARAVRLIAASEYVWDNGNDVAEETLRETVEQLRGILRPETALMVVERTRAEKAEYERGQFLAEVQRLTPQVTKMRGEIESLLRAKEIAENERDAARAHRRETESHLREAPPRRMQRKVEEQRKALCALQAKCAALVEKVAAQWARAERHASSERAQSAMWSARLATAEKERDRAHECIRRVKCLVAFTRDPYGTLVSVRDLVGRYS